MTAPVDKQFCVCGWRGSRSGLKMHPRQGYGVCPRCWSRGTERTTYDERAWEQLGKERA